MARPLSLSTSCPGVRASLYSCHLLAISQQFRRRRTRSTNAWKIAFPRPYQRSAAIVPIASRLGAVGPVPAQVRCRGRGGSGRCNGNDCPESNACNHPAVIGTTNPRTNRSGNDSASGNGIPPDGRIPTNDRATAGTAPDGGVVAHGGSSSVDDLLDRAVDSRRILHRRVFDRKRARGLGRYQHRQCHQ